MMAEKDLGFIHTFVPGQGSAPAALLLLHGTGGDESSLLPLGRELAPGAALLSPRGKVLEGRAPRFFRRLAEGVFDLADLMARTDELAAFIREAAGTYGLDPRRLFAVGYSNGANVAASLLLRHPDLLAGALLFRAMIPFEPELLPDRRGTAVYLAAGRRDPLIAPPLVERLAAVLQATGAVVDLRWQDAGHELTRAELAEARSWLHTAVGPEAGND